jgi:hypothetical protein
MKFLQSVPFRGMRQASRSPGECLNGLIARMAKRRGKSGTRSVTQAQHKQEAQRKHRACRAAARRIHRSASQRPGMGEAQPINPLQRNASHYAENPERRNSKIIQKYSGIKARADGEVAVHHVTPEKAESHMFDGLVRSGCFRRACPIRYRSATSDLFDYNSNPLFRFIGGIRVFSSVYFP